MDKTKGRLGPATPCAFWLQPFPKGEMVPVVPLGSGLVPNAPELECMPGAIALTPGSPQSIGVTNPPKAKGRGAVLPNTEPRAPLAWAWMAAPKPVAPAWPMGTPAGTLPKFGKMPGGPEGTWQAEAEGARPREADCAGLLKAGPAGVGAGIGDASADFPKLKDLLNLGPRGGWGAPCFCPSVGPGASWRGAPGEGGKGGLEPDPEGAGGVELTPQMQDVNAGWPLAAEAEAGRGLPVPPTLAVLLLGDMWTVLERSWLKMVTVWTVGSAARGWAGKVELAAWERPALQVQEARRSSVWQVAGVG